jgi:hypothetical protein
MATFVKRTDINKEFTALVNTFIKEGYTFAPTMSGHQGEEMKVDLDNGKETVRIRLERENWHDYDAKFYADGLELIVEIFDRIGKGSFDTLWSGKGKEIFRNAYYAVSDRNVNSVYTTDKQFIIDRIAIRHTRYKLKERKNTVYNYLDTDKAKKCVLSFVRRQPGCKTKTINDIVNISREFRDSGKFYSVRVNKGKRTEVYFMTTKATR